MTEDTKTLIDRQATAQKILDSDFPLNLLNSLVWMDSCTRVMEAVEVDEDGGDSGITPEMVQNLMQAAVGVVAEFRQDWAVYKNVEVGDPNQGELDLKVMPDPEPELEPEPEKKPVAKKKPARKPRRKKKAATASAPNDA